MSSVSMVRAYGFTVERHGVDEGSFYIDTPEASFAQDSEGVAVTMWSGSYPFAVDHDMGVLTTLEEAVRYAVWLLKREDWYNEQFDKMLQESE